MRVFIAVLLIAGIVAWIAYGDMDSVMELFDRYAGP